MTDLFKEDSSKAPHDFRKLKRPIRVKEDNKICQKYARQLLISGHNNTINLTYSREERSRFYTYYKKDRHPYISIDFSGILQEFRKLILY
jgi:hypothetical protein